MNCPVCGGENSDRATFCSLCFASFRETTEDTPPSGASPAADERCPVAQPPAERRRPRTAFWAGALIALGVPFVWWGGTLVVGAWGSMDAPDMGSLTAVLAVAMGMMFAVLGAACAIAGVRLARSALLAYRSDAASEAVAVTPRRHPAIMVGAGAVAAVVVGTLLTQGLSAVARWGATVQMAALGERWAEEGETVSLATGAEFTTPAGWRTLVSDPDATSGMQYIQLIPTDGAQDDGALIYSWDKDVMLPEPGTNYLADAASGADGVNRPEAFEHEGWTGTGVTHVSSQPGGMPESTLMARLEDPAGNVVLISAGPGLLAMPNASGAAELARRAIDVLELRPPPTR